jgi:hypothetical protein
MKVKQTSTKIHKVTVGASEYTETEGFIASVRINVEVHPDSALKFHDSEVQEAVVKLSSVGKGRVGDDGPNTYELKAKRLYKAMEHKFVSGDKKSNVVTIGIVKWVKFRVIDGVLSMRYDLDARMPLAPLSQLITFMDSQCTLTTTDAQADLFDLSGDKKSA